MSATYDKITALHYAAYRPQLHVPILRRCLGDKEFEYGLDIGCGTGVSTIALKTFCRHVTGVDPSKKMISQTVANDTMAYQVILDDKLPFPDHTFNICTYAGSWWYGKSQALLDETIRVSTTNGIILVYDFELNFSHVYHTLGYVQPDLEGYDHRSNFEQLDTSAIGHRSIKMEEKMVSVSPEELAHLLCSEKQIYRQVALKFSNQNIFNQLVQHIKECLDSERITVSTLTYYSLYEL